MEMDHLEMADAVEQLEDGGGAGQCRGGLLHSLELLDRHDCVQDGLFARESSWQSGRAAEDSGGAG